MRRYVPIPSVLHASFAALMAKERKGGQRYASNRNSVGMTGSILLVALNPCSKYVVKKACSMQIILTPNIKFKNTKLTKGRDKIPLRGYFLESICIGPTRKNFAIPNALEKRLIIIVKRGRASLLKISKLPTAPPFGWVG